jgi:hypothetical protein
MAVNITQSSILRFAELLLADGIEFWDLVENIEFPQSQEDINYQIQLNDRIDRVAFNFYGDSDLWWVIASANQMEVLPTDFKDGLIIRIPAPSIVRDSLRSLRIV